MIVCHKQLRLRHLDRDQTIKHCTRGIGIWDWARKDPGGEPDAEMDRVCDSRCIRDRPVLFFGPLGQPWLVQRLAWRYGTDLPELSHWRRPH